MMQLGIVTYNIAKDWDLPTIIERLTRLGYDGVELRTTHKHGVEPALTKDQRKEVRKRFEDSPIELVGLGSAFEFHSDDPKVVKQNVEGTKEFVRLAHDLNAPGVKVRPNGVPKGEDPQTTFKRIGDALREVGEDAGGFGVQIRVEVHGAVTSLLPNVATIIKHADCPNVGVCWNSNPSDVVDGTVRETFAMVADKIQLVHLRDLFHEDYPWRELFSLLQASGFQGHTLAEVPESSDPERTLKYFRALWAAYQPRPAGA